MRISEDDALRAATTTKQIRAGAGLEAKDDGSPREARERGNARGQYLQRMRERVEPR